MQSRFCLVVDPLKRTRLGGQKSSMFRRLLPILLLHGAFSPGFLGSELPGVIGSTVIFEEKLICFLLLSLLSAAPRKNCALND